MFHRTQEPRHCVINAFKPFVSQKIIPGRAKKSKMCIIEMFKKVHQQHNAGLV
jgi:hypothetical protein